MGKLFPPQRNLFAQRLVLGAKLLCGLLDLDAAIDLCSFVGGDFGLEIGEVRLLAFAESTLRSTILGFALCKGFCLGWLATGLSACR